MYRKSLRSPPTSCPPFRLGLEHIVYEDLEVQRHLGVDLLPTTDINSNDPRIYPSSAPREISVKPSIGLRA
jgi:hypothetical protein